MHLPAEPQETAEQKTRGQRDGMRRRETAPQAEAAAGHEPRRQALASAHFAHWSAFIFLYSSCSVRNAQNGCTKRPPGSTTSSICAAVSTSMIFWPGSCRGTHRRRSSAGWTRGPSMRPPAAQLQAERVLAPLAP